MAYTQRNYGARQRGGKVSQTLIDKMKDMGILKDLPDSNQLSLF